MNRTKGPAKPATPASKPKRKQIGVHFDVKLFRRFKAQAALEERSVAALFDDAMAMYLNAQRKAGGG